MSQVPNLREHKHDKRMTLIQVLTVKHLICSEFHPINVQPNSK